MCASVNVWIVQRVTVCPVHTGIVFSDSVNCCVTENVLSNSLYKNQHSKGIALLPSHCCSHAKCCYRITCYVNLFAFQVYVSLRVCMSERGMGTNKGKITSYERKWLDKGKSEINTLVNNIPQR